MASWLGRAKALWSRLFFWHTRTADSEEVRPEASHDHALVLSVQEAKSVSGWRKLAFLNHVLTPGEKRLFWSALVGAVALLFVGAWMLAEPHLIRVPTDGGTVTEALVGAPKLINPLYAPLNDVDRDLSSLIYSGLFRLDEKLEPKPDLVERYEWRENGTVLELVLRKDARFHDNTPVTSDDVVFTYQSIKSASWRSPLSSLFKALNVARVDDQTVQFILEKPEPQFLTQLTIGILPAHLWEDAPNPLLADLNLRPVGSGPYRISSLRRDQKGTILSYSLDRSEQYYGVKPYITTRVFRFFADQDQAVQAVKAHQADTLPFLPWAKAGVFTHDAVHPVALRLPQQTIAFFNLRDGLLKDAKLRTILTAAIDKAGLAETVKPSALAGGSPLPFLDLPDSVSTTTTSSTPATSTTPTLDSLRQALDAGGWKLDPATGLRSQLITNQAVRTTSRGKTTITKTTTSTGPLLALTIDVPDQSDLLRIADYLRQRWSLLGIKVTIKPHAAEELLHDVVTDRTSYQVLVWNILLPPTQDPAPFWSSDSMTGQGLNFSNLNSKTVDQKISEIQAATSTQMLQTARINFARALLTETPAIFLARPTYAYIVSDQIQGTSDLDLALPSDRLIRSSLWSVDSGLRWK
jgi:peptide/nickel transport system substrate-binding protein